MSDSRFGVFTMLIVIISIAVVGGYNWWAIDSAKNEDRVKIEQGRIFCETLDLYGRAIKADLYITGFGGRQSVEIGSYEEFKQLVSGKPVMFGRLTSSNPFSAGLFPYAYYAYPWNGTVAAEYLCFKE